MRLRLNSRILNVISSFGGCLDALILGLKPLLPGCTPVQHPTPSTCFLAAAVSFTAALCRFSSQVFSVKLRNTNPAVWNPRCDLSARYDG